MLKRAFDLIGALTAVVLLSPLLASIALGVKFSSRGPVFFRQERMGRGFVPFRIFKFRTMVADAERLGGPLTHGAADPRITRLGAWLRRTKIDELPQLFNVVTGDMSLVGPRPEVRKYVEMFADDYTEILSVRPGITDSASLRFRDEAALLGRTANPESLYVSEILPQKIEMAKQYVRSVSLSHDLKVLVLTLVAGVSSESAAMRADR